MRLDGLDPMIGNIQGGFFNWSPSEDVSRLAPPKNASTAPPPPKSSKYENHIQILRHLDFFLLWGGASLGL